MKLFKQELATRVDLTTKPQLELYDVAILGAGPAGLTAALYAASEGRDNARRRGARPGRAGRDERADRELSGLPDGVSGAELAASIHAQASRLGAEILVGVELVRAMPGDGVPFELELTGGAIVGARASIAANGVH